MFLWSFLFLASPHARECARVQSSLRSGDCAQEAEKLSLSRWPRLGAQADLPRETVPRKFSQVEAAVQPGPSRRSPAPTPPTLAGSAPFHPGAARGPRICLRLPSSTVGATLSSRGPGRGWGRRRLAPLAGKRGQRAALSSSALHFRRPSAQGLAPTCPWRVALRAPSWDGCTPETFGFGELMDSPSASPGKIRIFSHRKTHSSPWVSLLPRHARTLWSLMPLTQAPKCTCEVCPAAFSYSSASPGTPRIAKGSRGHSVWGAGVLENSQGS